MVIASYQIQEASAGTIRTFVQKFFVRAVPNQVYYFCQQVPDHLKVDNFNTKYDLVVEGNEYGKFHGSLFLHKEQLKLKRPHVDILLEAEQQVYKQGQTSKFHSEYHPPKKTLKMLSIILVGEVNPSFAHDRMSKKQTFWEFSFDLTLKIDLFILSMEKCM